LEPDLSPGTIGLVVVVLATVLYCFASLMEGAIGSLSRSRVQRLVEQDGSVWGRLVSFVERPAPELAAAAMMKLVALIVAAVGTTALLLGAQAGDAATAGLLVFGGAVILGWILARGVAARWPEALVLRFALPFRLLGLVFGPLSWVVLRVSDGLAHLLGAAVTAEGPVVTAEELKVMVAASEEEGLIEEGERTMIDNVLELEGKSVREVMVPRPDIVALTTTTTVRGAVDTFVREGYSRLPIYRDTIDDVVGVLYGKDLFPLVLEGRLTDAVGSFARPAYFVPESKKADDLLRELQLRRVHIAIVVDEYGGTAGLVTIEDLLEEIVGEIQDEYDVEEAKIVPEGDGEAIVDGTVSIDDVNEELQLDLTGEEVDTIGGLVYEQLGRVPVVGDKVAVDHALLTVVGSHGRRVTRVRVKRLPAESPNGSANHHSTAG
jgi:putative hemolysin